MYIYIFLKNTSPKIFIAAKGHYVERFQCRLDAQYLHQNQYQNYFYYEPSKCRTSLNTQLLWCELILHTYVNKINVQIDNNWRDFSNDLLPKQMPSIRIQVTNDMMGMQRSGALTSNLGGTASACEYFTDQSLNTFVDFFYTNNNIQNKIIKK